MEKVRNRFKTTDQADDEALKNIKLKKKKTPTSQVKSNFALSKRILTILGLASIFLGLFIFLSSISYIFTWTADQDAVFQYNWGQLFNKDFQATNIFGKLGALTSHTLIYELFGISSLLFSIVLVLYGINLFTQKNFFKVWKWAIVVTITVVLFALVSSFVLPNSGFAWGGSMGRFGNEWLQSFIGQIGAGILYFFLVLGAIVFFFDLDLFDFVQRKLKTSLANDVDEFQDEDIRITQALDTTDLLDGEPKKNAFIKNDEKQIEDDAKEEAQFEAPLTKRHEIIEEEDEDDDDFVIVQPKIDRPLIQPSTQTKQEVSQQPSVGLELEEIEEEQLVDELKHEFDPTLELSNYKFPTLDLLESHGAGNVEIDREELEKNKNQIVETLRNYKIEISKIKATVGPTVTLYEIIPAAGVRISKIKNLEDDIALSLAALGIRIIAPIPGKGTIGIEVPNTHKNVVSMKSMLASEKFVNSTADLPVAVGKTISNENYIADLARMPHLLIAGATGQGKSVGINSLLISLLYKKHPSELKFVLIDPKKVELSIYSLIENHFLAKLPGENEAIITDTAKVVATLNSLCIEMDERYELLKNAHCRNLKEYNTKFKQRRLNPEKGHRYLPYIVLVIDEFADLIMTAGKEVESPIARLAQLARAIGIHLIIATQRPSVNIITGIIKANFPARIAFRVMSKIDSRTILDMGGADQLIGRGDMILSIGSDAIRLQCPFVDTPEVEDITRFIADQQSYGHAYELPEYSGEEGGGSLDDDEELDELFFDAARMVVQNDSGSTSMLQRRMKLGYNRAGRIMDQLERAGIVGPAKGSKPREVLFFDEIELERFLESLM